MKRIWLILGGIVLLALLVGAAFVGGRLLNAQGQAQAPGSGPVMVTSKDGGGARVQIKLDMEPAKELPATPADVKGIFQRRENSSIFIGTGQVSVMALQTQDGAISMTSKYDGPVMEVVITHDTTIYRDVTMKQFDGPPPAGQKMQQVVEPGTADEVGENSLVQVWGEKRGDRIVANMLVYSLPAFIKMGP